MDSCKYKSYNRWNDSKTGWKGISRSGPKSFNICYYIYEVEPMAEETYQRISIFHLPLHCLYVINNQRELTVDIDV